MDWGFILLNVYIIHRFGLEGCEIHIALSKKAGESYDIVEVECYAIQNDIDDRI